MALKSKILQSLSLCVCLVALTGFQSRLGSFESRLLAGHNQARSEYGMGHLDWDDGLASDAQVWADHLARSGRFEHSPNTPGAELQGENLWIGTAGAFTPEDMVGLWVAERQYFRRGVFPNNSLSGNVADVSHFTQIVWHNTRRVGCALAENAKEEVLVCRYSSPGNIRGQQPFGRR